MFWERCSTSGAGQVLWIDLHCSHSYDCCAYFSRDLPGRGKLQVQGPKMGPHGALMGPGFGAFFHMFFFTKNNGD